MSSDRLSSIFRRAESAHKPSTDRHSVERSGQSLIKDHDQKKWTREQELFLSQDHPRLLLTALAGSGKTSLLMEYARRRPHQTWHFVAFNRSVADFVARHAPKNIKAKTAHQWAFARFGNDLHEKLTDNEKAFESWLAKTYKNKDREWRREVIDVLDQFLINDDRFPGQSATLNFINPDELNDVWAQMLSPKSSCPITHDGYLKRFCLLDQWMGQNFMLDEAQDWSEAFLSAWDRATTRSIRAGDPFQQMYQWRGASQKSWVRSHEKEFWLTQSFRTGFGAQDLINASLKKMGCSQLWMPASHPLSLVFADEPNLQDVLNFSPTHVIGSSWQEIEVFSDQLKSNGASVALAKNLEEMSGEALPSHAIIATTIHQMKGREGDRVWVIDEKSFTRRPGPEKLRLMYVAMTRAKSALALPKSYQNLTSTHTNSSLSSSLLPFDDDGFDF